MHAALTLGCGWHGTEVMLMSRAGLKGVTGRPKRRCHGAPRPDGLRDRLEELPHVKGREQGTVRHRYADRQPRWFPAALTFLVPASMEG